MAGRKKGDLEHDAGTNQSPATGQLRAIIQRIERVSEEISVLQEDRKEIYAEAKAFGLDPKIIRIIVRRRAMDKAKRDEQDALVHLYSKAIGESSPADAEDDETTSSSD